MRYKGNILEKRTTEVKLPKGDVVLRVSAVPLGWDLQFAEIWPEPPVKYRTVNKVGGQSESTPVHSQETERETSHRENCKLAYRVYLALRNDPNLTFEAEPKDSQSMQQLAKELAESFLESGDVTIILMAAATSANLDDKSYNEALKHFA